MQNKTKNNMFPMTSYVFLWFTMIPPSFSIYGAEPQNIFWSSLASPKTFESLENDSQRDKPKKTFSYRKLWESPGQIWIWFWGGLRSQIYYKLWWTSRPKAPLKYSASFAISTFSISLWESREPSCLCFQV